MGRVQSIEVAGVPSPAAWARWWGFALAATLLAGCGTRFPGVVSPDGYVSGRYPLSVHKSFDAPDAAGLLPEGWQLDNFKGDDPKDGPAYRTTIRIDADGDGDFEQQEEAPAYELRFVHLHHAGVVWLRAVPVADDLAKKDLRVMTQAYVEALAGGQYETTELDRGSAKTVEKRFASTLLKADPCQLASQECEASTIELANVDQLKLDPKYRSNEVMVVIARTPFTYRTRMRRTKHPVYLVAGYSNQPDKFDTALPDFLAFLKHIEMTGKQGFVPSTGSGSSSPSPPPAAAPAPTPDAAPAPDATPTPTPAAAPDAH